MIEIERLARDIIPANTVLFFGSGASIPSKAPSVARLNSIFEQEFNFPNDNYSLREYAGILEHRFGRRRLIDTVRAAFKDIKPTGSLLNIPLLDWKSIFTTNYDTLIEQAYAKRNSALTVYESNFDFSAHTHQTAAKLFKLHGSIDKDICYGHKSRIIITDSDYDYTHDYRQGLYSRLESDLLGGHLCIIGHSLSDEDIKDVANRALAISNKSPDALKITLLMFSRDENRAALWENRGIQVCFGGVDQFFQALDHKLPATLPSYISSADPLDQSPSLRSTAVDVAYEAGAESQAFMMFNGAAATYADIEAKLTFDRDLTADACDIFQAGKKLAVVFLGPSGIGKTTMARQVLLSLRNSNFLCWEHKKDFPLVSQSWVAVARKLTSDSQNGILFVDDAHIHLFELNQLIDSIRAERLAGLKILAVSSRNYWNPRTKSAGFFKDGTNLIVNKLSPNEISRLITLTENNQTIRRLISEDFNGFSKYEKRRRLTVRCDSETFVCLRNIFATESFDNIILREYSQLHPEHQEIYKLVAALEHSGVHVHRQFLIRFLGMPADSISATLTHLTDIIKEYEIKSKEGIYGWRCRHQVISGIISRYKYALSSDLIKLFERVIESIAPTYDIEIQSLRELCSIESGISVIPNRADQNTLYGKIISLAPAERIPRHRLIRNLIEMGSFERAEAEIRIFEKDFRQDGPVARYKVRLLVARALNSEGLMIEDRVAILQSAKEAALAAVNRNPDNFNIIGSYCEVGLGLMKFSHDTSVFDDAMGLLRRAQRDIGDPQITKLIRRYEQRFSGDLTNVEKTEPE